LLVKTSPNWEAAPTSTAEVKFQWWGVHHHHTIIFSLEYTVINCCHKSNNATCYDWTPNIRVLVISPHYFSWPSFGSNIIPNSCHTQVIIFLSRRIGKKLTHRPQLQVLYLRVDSLQLNLPSIYWKEKKNWRVEIKLDPLQYGRGYVSLAPK
jgi:hypothetical protein